MPAASRRIRISAEVNQAGTCIDELTGKNAELYVDQAVEFEFALFRDGAMLGSADLGDVDFTLDDGVTPITATVASFDGAATARQWRTGVGYLFSVLVTAGAINSLNASNTIAISLYVTDVDGNQALFLASNITLTTLLAPVTASTPTPAPSYYNKTQSDARYPAIADFATAEADIAALEAVSTVHYTAQTLTGGEKTQARTNIGAAAAAASLEGFTAGALVFADYQAWNATLAADQALTATGTPSVGVPYAVNLIQDATGGWEVTWPAGFIINAAAILNPKPSTTTPFMLRARRIAGGAFETTVEPFNEPAQPGAASWAFDVRHYARLTLSGSDITSITDKYSALAPTYATARGAFVADGLGGRNACSMAGTGYYTMAASGLTAPIQTSIPGGFTIAMVFDSRAAADARLVHLGPLGMSVDQRGGNLEFGSQSASANRVAIPFTPNDSTRTLAIFTYHAGGGASGVLFKNGAAVKTAYAAGAVAGTTTTEWQLFQTQGGTARWTGRISLVELYESALSWAQVQALAAKLCGDFNIT